MSIETGSLAIAEVPTQHAASYLRQLCRHWAHKFPVVLEDDYGRIELPRAVCTLNASAEALTIRVETADPSEEPRMLEVVAEHLQRFGFREQLVFNWQLQGRQPAA